MIADKYNTYYFIYVVQYFDLIFRVLGKNSKSPIFYDLQVGINLFLPKIMNHYIFMEKQKFLKTSNLSKSKMEIFKIVPL